MAVTIEVSISQLSEVELLSKVAHNRRTEETQNDLPVFTPDTRLPIWDEQGILNSLWPCLLGVSIQHPICLEIASNTLCVWRLSSIRLTPTSNISRQSQVVTCVPGCLTINRSSHNPLGLSWFAGMASPISGLPFLRITGLYTPEILKDPEEGTPRAANRGK